MGRYRLDQTANVFHQVLNFD